MIKVYCFLARKINYNNKMSLKSQKDKDAKSVTKYSACSHTQNDSCSDDISYEQEFTLMGKVTKQPTKNREACLAMKIALSFPPKIRD